MIPLSEQKVEKFFEMYLPPLSVRRVHSTYFLPCRVFNYPKEMLKFFKHLTFLCNEVYPDVPREVVSKGDKKSRSTSGADAKRAANVRVYELESSRCSEGGYLL